MLMNLKMVAMATNLWVRNFQPNGIVVSVSGRMGMAKNLLPSEGDIKEYIQRLLKEGSRLRFGVAGDDISKVQINYPKLDTTIIEKINQLNISIRKEYKLGGLVIDLGDVKTIDQIDLLLKLKVCEIKLKLPKNIATWKNFQKVIQKCGIDNPGMDIVEYSMKINQFPRISDF
jgi:hypothetical protein